MRPAVLILIACALVAGCGSSKRSGPSFAGVETRTVAAGPAHFALKISIDAAGTRITAEENGGAAFTGRRAHLYKQLPGSRFPQELVILGPITYTNANVQAALADPTVQPWTRLDTRKLTAGQRSAQPDELAHVIAPAYLSDGVATPKAGGKESDGTYRFTGVVDPARLARRAPAAIMGAVRNDYPAAPFPATFWLDAQGRLSRVLVRYTTAQGTKLTVDTVYSDYGAKLDLTLPDPAKIKDITP